MRSQRGYRISPRLCSLEVQSQDSMLEVWPHSQCSDPTPHGFSLHTDGQNKQHTARPLAQCYKVEHQEWQDKEFQNSSKPNAGHLAASTKSKPIGCGTRALPLQREEKPVYTLDRVYVQGNIYVHIYMIHHVCVCVCVLTKIWSEYQRLEQLKTQLEF